MAILISEIEISLTVVADQQPTEPTNANVVSKDLIIKECVEMVMEILNQKNER